MQVRPPALVFSDLDGTLLDHSSYSWEAAATALSCLKKLGCGVVLATSKTAAEVVQLRERIGFSDWPAIVENGAGLLPPGFEADAGTEVYEQVLAHLADLPSGFVGFGQMSPDELCDLTGLSRNEAMLAKRRAFTEPGLWTGSDTDLVAFRKAAELAGLTMQRGGRFYSLSFGGTKACRMSEIVEEYKPAITVALGDAPNDIAMLERAEFGVIVANSASPPLPPISGEEVGRIRRTTREGPKGWSDAVFDILEETFIARDKINHG